MIRVALPMHLKILARVSGEVSLEVPPPITLENILQTLEQQYPTLLGTIRDQVTHQRRPFLRFFACEKDFSHLPADTLLPEEIASGKEPLLVVGAVAGG